MKVKLKKQMTLSQLIEWAMENDITNKWYRATDDNEYISEVFFNVSGLPQFSSTVDKSDTFTVEVEEEITEDTVIPKIVSIGRKNENEINIHHYCRISQFIDYKDFNYYVLNDDDTLTLIWRDGKLLEE